MTDAALSLGSNLGDPEVNLTRAYALIAGLAETEIVAASDLYQTPAWGLEDQPDFLNACLLLDTQLDPQTLLEACLDIETRLGRVRDIRWGPRLIDIDLLWWGTAAISTPALTIPHPHMLDRAFVLTPLAEIAPDKRIDGQRISDWSAKQVDPSITPHPSAVWPGP